MEKLKKEVPPGPVKWLPIPGLGPKRAAMIWKALNITTFAELQAAAKEGKLVSSRAWAPRAKLRTVRIPLGRTCVSQQIDMVSMVHGGRLS